MPSVVFPQRFNTPARRANLCPVINAAEGWELCIVVVASGADWEFHHSLCGCIVAQVEKKVSTSFPLPLPLPIGINRQAVVDCPLRLWGRWPPEWLDRGKFGHRWRRECAPSHK